MFTRNFKQLSKLDVSIAGGKGASLGEMAQAGISVPPGFVVLSGAFEQFVEETGIRADIESVLGKVKHNDTNSVERASEKIQGIILSEGMPKDIATEIKKEFKKLNAKFVAVRSSATAEDSSSAAWAGQLETYLNTTEKDVLTNVKRCWASLFTPRAIFYRFEKGLQKQFISVAVVIQKMVQSEVSGISFSVHPVTEDYNQLIIEAGFGLGEAIVSGSVTPDSYVVKKKELEIEDITVSTQSRMLVKAKQGNEWKSVPEKVGAKQKLSKPEILKFAKLVIAIEKHYGFPCDIEWAKEGSNFYITQSRPITTLSKQNYSVPPAIVFKKSYSRDTSLFMQGLWAQGLVQGVKDRFGWNNPHLPLVAHFVNEGTVEIWEHKDAIAWFMDKLLEENKKGTQFLERILKEYKPLLAQLKEIHTKGNRLSKKDLEVYTKLVYEAALDMTLFFYTGVDERSPVKAKKIAVQARKEGDFFAENDTFIRNYIIKLAQVSEECASVVLPEEIAKIPNTKILKRRVKQLLLVDGQNQYMGSLESFSKKNSQFIFEKIKVDQGQKNISGQVAYKGLVRGRVRIVKNKTHMGEVKVGDILVSPMTTPDFLPAMQKAAAFVTDEGGVTCHAAIVAREMKKPCIIGTKIATEVLKDGDLVEVDADNGVVRKLENASESVYSKLFSRDFCLASVEAWVRGESTNPKGWTQFKQPFLPYIVTERSDDTVHFYYDMRGVAWIQDLLVHQAKEENNFLKKIEKTILEKLKYIRPIYETGRILKLPELKKFLRELEAGYPWFEAMWWYCQMDAEKIKGLDIKNIQKVRALTDVLCNGSDTVIRKSLAEIYPQLGNAAVSLGSKEIFFGNIPGRKILEKRDTGYFFANDRLFVGANKADVEKKLNIVFEKEVAQNKTEEFKGEIAQKGKVIGKVRRVMGHKQINDLKEGEVLVSPMTIPDFLPAIKKAVAIVTDEGGLTCHAAIIARELRKPCIVGTKIATEVLKDGDMVEVDADNGVVKIITKSK
jgi:phosphoenolpyruvate synthase/pyruvate phosphate dikinase